MVSLSSSNPILTVPATVTLGSGATSEVFTVTSRKVSTPTQVTLTATYNGVTKTVVVTLNP